MVVSLATEMAANWPDVARRRPARGRIYNLGAAMTTRCEPPEAFRHHRWHWLGRGGGPEPFRWGNGQWNGIDYVYDPIDAAQFGWRWLGAAIPPTEEKGK